MRREKGISFVDLIAASYELEVDWSERDGTRRTTWFPLQLAPGDRRTLLPATPGTLGSVSITTNVVVGGAPDGRTQQWDPRSIR
ncbi:MAG: hypothetical protein R3F34_18730 [Planctomycetota bacterium]